MIGKTDPSLDDSSFIRNSQAQLNYANNFQNEIRQQLALRGITPPTEQIQKRVEECPIESRMTKMENR